MRRLKATWGAGWYLWRGHRSPDPNGGVRDGDWIATRIDKDAGVDATVMTDSAEQLDAELKRQAELAFAVRRLVAVLRGRGLLTTTSGMGVVEVSQPETGRGDTVMLSHSEGWNTLAWYWRCGDGPEPIGRAIDLEIVAGKIADSVGGPRAADWAGVWRDRP